jgi:hypothetical protein
MMLVEEDQSDSNETQYEEAQEHPAELQQRMGHKSAQSTVDESESRRLFLSHVQSLTYPPESGL